jgi:hypothetical protein
MIQFRTEARPPTTAFLHERKAVSRENKARVALESHSMNDPRDFAQRFQGKGHRERPH